MKVFSSIIAAIALMQASILVDSFQPTAQSNSRFFSTELSMGKGLNKFKNKQADLKRKLELAKQQKREAAGENADETNDGDPSITGMSDQEIKEMNDRKRFEQLLKQEGAKVLNDYTSDSYLNNEQEEEEITAARKCLVLLKTLPSKGPLITHFVFAMPSISKGAGVDRIFEGDPAPTDCFENLVSATTENIVAKKGAGRLVPWISKDWGIDEDDYRVILCDPRKKSLEFHKAIIDLNAGIPKDIKNRLYYINADTPAENRKWMKKNGIEDIEMYCDEDLNWMRTYTALGEKRWSMTMFVICKGRVVKLAREVDIYNVCRTVTNAVKSMKKEQ